MQLRQAKSPPAAGRTGEMSPWEPPARAGPGGHLLCTFLALTTERESISVALGHQVFGNFLGD